MGKSHTRAPCVKAQLKNEDVFVVLKARRRYTSLTLLVDLFLDKIPPDAAIREARNGEYNNTNASQVDLDVKLRRGARRLIAHRLNAAVQGSGRWRIERKRMKGDVYYRYAGMKKHVRTNKENATHQLP